MRRPVSGWRCVASVGSRKRITDTYATQRPLRHGLRRCSRTAPAAPACLHLLYTPGYTDSVHPTPYTDQLHRLRTPYTSRRTPTVPCTPHGVHLPYTVVLWSITGQTWPNMVKPWVIRQGTGAGTEQRRWRTPLVQTDNCAHSVQFGQSGTKASLTRQGDGVHHGLDTDGTLVGV